MAVWLEPPKPSLVSAPPERKRACLSFKLSSRSYGQIAAREHATHTNVNRERVRAGAAMRAVQGGGLAPPRRTERELRVGSSLRTARATGPFAFNDEDVRGP
jgi:hypothetical protein